MVDVVVGRKRKLNENSSDDSSSMKDKGYLKVISSMNGSNFLCTDAATGSLIEVGNIPTATSMYTAINAHVGIN